MLSFFEKGRRPNRQRHKKALLKIQDESSLENDKSQDLVKPAAEQSQSEHRCSGHERTNSEGVELPFNNDSPETEVEQSQSTGVKAEAKRQAHLLWQSVYGRKPILCDDLEKVIPDTLTISKKWVEMDSCDPKKDYISEWKMKWDCEDDNDESWNDEKGKLGSESDPLEFNRERVTMGRCLQRQK